LKDRGQTK